MAISQDPTSLKETWLDLDGRRLLYRTNADSPPAADAAWQAVWQQFKAGA